MRQAAYLSCPEPFKAHWISFVIVSGILRNSTLVGALLTGLLAGGPLGAQEPSATAAARSAGVLAGRPTIRPIRTEIPPEIDGRLNDPVWQTATAVTDFVQYEPVDGAVPTETTEMYVAFDRNHIYFAFYAHYTDPSILRANRADRDQAFEDDLLTVYFDTFMDQQRSFDFDLNAYNVQGDGIINLSSIVERGAGIPRADRSWDALFESGAEIVEDGFTAEMAIPFKSLRYPQLPPGVPHRWGFQFVREIKERDRERIVWAPMTRDVRSFMGQMGVLEGMTDLSTSHNLEIMPTVTGIRFGSLDTPTGTFSASNQPEAGVNLKYGVTSNLTADFTFNPDFSQIESDLSQIEVNRRFPLFFPELRPFFIEGNEIFAVSGPVPLVHTRTIVDPLFGAKLTGKVGRFTVGVLTANDEAPGNLDDESDPAFGHGAQTFIGRAKYDLYSESHIGAIVTNRNFLDSRSTLSGVDGGFRLSRIHRFSAVAARSTQVDTDGLERLGHMVDLQLRRNGRNFDWSLGGYEISPHFDTEVGFVRRQDQRRVVGNVSFRWFPQNWIIDWGPRVSYGRNWNFDGVLDDVNLREAVTFSLARNLRAGAAHTRDMERFSGVEFLKHRYSFVGGVNNRTFAANVGWTAGDEIFFDADDPYLGREVATSIGLDLRPTARLQSRVSLTTSRFNDSLRGGSEVFDIKIIRGLTTFQFTERFLVRNIAEYNTFDKEGRPQRVVRVSSERRDRILCRVRRPLPAGGSHRGLREAAFWFRSLSANEPRIVHQIPDFIPAVRQVFFRSSANV